MKAISYIIVLLISFLLSENATSQSNTIVFNGRVSGYNLTSSKILKKMKKNVYYEGALKNVEILLINKQTVYKSKTNADGSFSLKLKPNTTYTLKFSYANYTSPTYYINTQNIPIQVNENSGIIGFEALLISNDSKLSIQNEDVGSFVYNNKTKKFDFVSFNENDENEWFLINTDLAKKTVNISPKIISFKTQLTNNEQLDSINSETNQLFQINKSIEHKIDSLTEIYTHDTTIASISILENELIELKRITAEYEASGNADTTILHRLYLQIELYEKELKTAKRLLYQKDKIISLHKNIQTLLILVIIFLLLIIGLILYLLNEKKKHLKLIKNRNTVIEKQNDKIEKSLTFSKILQESMLHSAKKLQSFFGENSFIYYKPKELVGGDLYWFHEKNNYKYLFVGDCTGHGVPGALLSMLTLGIIEQMTQKEIIISASDFLHKLGIQINHQIKNEKFKSFFGLDASIIIIHPDKKITFSGALNGIYLNSENNLTFIKPDIISLGSSEQNDFILNEKIIDAKKGDKLILFTDGFMDQMNVDKEKINRNRFEELINKNVNNLSSDVFNAYLESWKSDLEQTDDVTIIGIQV